MNTFLTYITTRIATFFLILGSIFVFAFPSISNAQLPLFLFGGPVLATFPCTCSGTWLLTIGPPTPAFIVYANTPQYEYYQLPRPGVWTLGYYFPQVGICYVYVVVGCVSIPNQGLISPWVGTSL